jgi:hypothetical protein
MEFVDSDSEYLMAASSKSIQQKGGNAEAEFRPGRLGLGYSVERLRSEEKKAEEDEKLKIKMVGKKRIDRESDLIATIIPGDFSEDDEDEKNFKKFSVDSKKPSGVPLPPPVSNLTQSQKKRMRKKLKKDG